MLKQIKVIRVCHLTSVHSRYDVRIFHKECKSLAQAGYEVYLIVADGLGNEFIDEIRIIDIGKMSSRVKRIMISTYKIYKIAKSLNASIYHFHDPELIPAGLMLKKNNVIYDIHEDYYKQILFKKYMPYLLRLFSAKFYRLSEIIFLRRFSGLIVPQPTMVKVYKSKNKNTELICNFVKLNGYPCEELGHKKGNFIYYGGGLSEDQGLLNMVLAINKVSSNIKLLLAGRMNSVLLDKIARADTHQRVQYLGVLSMEESISYCSNSILGLILYNNVGQYHLSYAIKLFEYMRFGIPVIMPNFGEWISFNEENQCGINVDVQNHQMIGETIEKLFKEDSLRAELGNNGKEAILNKYNWESEANKLREFYFRMILT